MTVSTTTNKIVYIANGSTTTFTFPFAVNAITGQTDIQAFQTDAFGDIIQLVEGTQYTVTLNAASAPNPTPVGGSITTLFTPPNGALITILRTMAEKQTTSLANQGSLYQPVVEAMSEYITMLTQQIAELQGRAITVAVSDPAPVNLPPAAQRANLAMGFDVNGNPIAFSTAPAGTISAAMASFVASASIAAAKLLLGYGSMANENIGAVGKGIADDGSGNALVGHTISAVATNQSPAAAQHMTDYVSSGTLIFTLPKLSTVFNGYELWVFCVSGTATLSPNASDNFPTLGGGVGVVLLAGQCARIVGDGVSQWAISVDYIQSMSVNKPAFALLNSLTASSSATLSDTTSLTTNYSAYEIIFEDLVPATGGGVTLELQVHSGGAFKSTSYLANLMTLSSSGTGNITSTTAIPLSNVNADTTSGVSGKVRIYNPAGTSVIKKIMGESTFTVSASAIQSAFFGGVWNGGTGAVDGFQILFSTGNIASGTVKVYGIL